MSTLMTTNNVTLIYITCKNSNETKKIAKALIGENLIACANTFPITSMYKWKGKMENSKEIILIAKTKSMNYGKIKKIVSALHSYKTPCIMKISAVANEPYYKWLMGEMK